MDLVGLGMDWKWRRDETVNSAREQCTGCNFKPNLDLDAINISQNSKHESCRAIS